MYHVVVGEKTKIQRRTTKPHSSPSHYHDQTTPPHLALARSQSTRCMARSGHMLQSSLIHQYVEEEDAQALPRLICKSQQDLILDFSDPLSGAQEQIVLRKE